MSGSSRADMALRKAWKPPALLKDRAINAIAKDFIRTANALGSNKITVTVNPIGSAPASSYGTEVYINKNLAPPMTTDQHWGVVRGLCFHELAHIRYTPSIQAMNNVANQNPLARQLMHKYPPGLFSRVWNILEDARAERLFLAEHPDFADYLTLCVMHYIVGDGKDLSDAFLYLDGRWYIPWKLRMRARERYKSQQHVGEIAQIIASYRRLNLYNADDLHEAYKLVARLTELLKQIDPKYEITDELTTRCCSTQTLTAGGDLENDRIQGSRQAAVVAVANQQEDTDNAESSPNGGPSAQPDDGNPTTDATAGPGGQPGGQQEDADNTESSPNGESSVQSDDGKPTDATTDSGGQPGGAAAGVNDSGDAYDDAVSDAAIVAEVCDAASNNPIVRRYLDGLRAVVRDDLLGVDEQVVEWIPPESELGTVVRSLSKALRRIEEDADEHWQPNRPNGRVNVARYGRITQLAEQRGLVAPDYSEVFDEWRERQATGSNMETVVLVDVSHSMRYYLDQLSKAVWCIKRTSDQHQIRCTVLAYSTRHAVVWGARDRAVGRPYFPSLGGGTVPTAALIDAHRVLARSDKAHRLLLILTDGVWSMATSDLAGYGGGLFTDTDQLIEDLGARGVATALAFLGNVKEVNPHQCQEWRVIQSVDELPLFYREQVVNRLLSLRKS